MTIFATYQTMDRQQQSFAAKYMIVNTSDTACIQIFVDDVLSLTFQLKENVKFN